MGGREGGGHSPFSSGKRTLQGKRGLCGVEQASTSISQLEAVENYLPQTLGHIAFKESESPATDRHRTKNIYLAFEMCEKCPVHLCDFLWGGFFVLLLFETGSFAAPNGVRVTM